MVFSKVLKSIDMMRHNLSHFAEAKIFCPSNPSMTLTNLCVSSLLLAILETGTKNGTGEVVRTVERCICPDGYSGLLCQYCSYGYARILPDSPNKHAVCTLCDCNNHAVSCDPINAVCTVSTQITCSDHSL